MSKIVTIIGAASTTFGPKLLRDVLNHEEMWGCTFNFIDINEERLSIYVKLANKVNSIIKRPININYSTNRRDLLRGSDYVVLSIDTGHYNTWRQDFDLPCSMGSRQVLGELGGPGGLFHSLRQIPLHMEVGNDIKELCPDACVMISSNPLNRICQALKYHCGLKNVVGLCHGAEMSPHLYWNRLLGMDGYDIDFIAAGTNHNTWALDVRSKKTGEDLLPAIAKAINAENPCPYPLTRKILNIFGCYPACLDNHFGEYMPFAKEFVPHGQNFDYNLEQEDKRWKFLNDLAEDKALWDMHENYVGAQEGTSDELKLDSFFEERSWKDTLCIPIIASMISNEKRHMYAINLVNEGQIENLQRNYFVETPAIIDASGIKPIAVGSLPKNVAPFNRRDIEQAEATVEAAVTGDRNILMQAMLLDPVVDSISASEKMMNALLELNKPYLKLFFE